MRDIGYIISKAAHGWTEQQCGVTVCIPAADDGITKSIVFQLLHACDFWSVTATAAVLVFLMYLFIHLNIEGRQLCLLSCYEQMQKKALFGPLPR